MSRQPDDELARTLARVNRLAWWLDQSLRLPVIGRRIGADALLGLVPVVGDALGGLASLYIVAVAARIGVPRSVLLRMGANLLLDAVVGAVPLAGDLFDMGFKANVRNAQLLMRHAADEPTASAHGPAVRSGPSSAQAGSAPGLTTSGRARRGNGPARTPAGCSGRRRCAPGK